MLNTLRNAFKIKDIRQKMFFTFLMLIVIRIGSQIPVPGVNRGYFAAWFSQQTGDAFNFFDAFTGGSFTSMSIFALNISPYITSSIIIQLLTIAIPKLEEMQKEEDGTLRVSRLVYEGASDAAKKFDELAARRRPRRRRKRKSANTDKKQER